ncbi:MAG TPA: hypothetical protein DEG42_07135 [Acholeplasmataceae bacterium]|nr:MAG: hypothetical protein A2084_02755 [Tenericutes bacterium GWC2_39_45]OHE31458.1 MAG: hypothetical protein A2009_05175 [Tenericutes bacterium GWD2_38_27]OHE39847.1 MAG: hypothetical protein A2013_03955 [Tenericutes bacterium GWE2_38_8]OHE41995.1 MAG: hypothetical protein A2102_00585 [Tenericutes bacterium GWF2_38_8]HBG32537.1 hypothetical protein [Acholeplasmataceae bacterium]
MIANIFIGLTIFWIIVNIIWFVVLTIKKYAGLTLPKEFQVKVKKTVIANFYYLFIFGLLGFLFL